ncbi:hypothetical protein [Luteimonas sp. MC1895]|uniref:hypothetical protein n=1 Tax=Luteimonas sp. MC1895 TaxID=2819513 RepID=UPI0018F0E009|nr:hypothetical protein [Luteimonas sp. MC1895]MBJ6979408.1 hypothetical protein [Luteimonas sp. MC1895]
MHARRVLRASAWAVAALLGFVVLAYLVLLAVNWSDEAPSADAQRLAALAHDRPALADAANGYVHAITLAGDSRDTDARSAEVAALAASCSRALACIAASEADPAALAQWRASEQWLLDGYRRMLETDRWREAVPGDAFTPLADYRHALGGQTLHLLAVREKALAGDPAAVRELLERDLVFWRRVLASSDLLLTKMVAVAAVERNLDHGNLALRELAPDLVAAAVPPSWQQPLTTQERSLLRPLGGEWEMIGGTLRNMLSPDPAKGGAGERWSRRLQRPLFHEQATRNLFATRMVRMGELSELPYPALGPAVEALGTEAAPVRFRPYNLLGTVLEATGPATVYSTYASRIADLEGLRRATLLVATLRSEGIAREHAAAAVATAALRNPYDDTAFVWDAADAAVLFRGLQRGDREPYAVPW